MGVTSIEWTDRSINPVRARLGDATGHYCEKVSAGCTHCYASGMQPRFGMPPFETQRRLDVEPFFDAARLNEVLRRKKPTRWFWCDMSDLFGPWVPDAWIDQCFAVMALTPQHTHQILTKRPERMREYFGVHDGPVRLGDFIDDGTPDLRDRLDDASGAFGACHANLEAPGRWPLPNVWLGTSVEDQATANARIPILLDTPAAVRFVSAEPLLGPVDFSPYLPVLTIGGVELEQWLDLVIVGGESGPGARPCDVAWIRSVVAQCKLAAVPVFVKQLGACIAWPPAEGIRQGLINIKMYHLGQHPRRDEPFGYQLCDRKGGDPEEWPEDLRVREFPRESQGW